nr:MAG TPA: hypothetical protein [Bacteriophage sp.]
MVDKKFLDKEGLEYVCDKILKKISGSDYKIGVFNGRQEVS